MGRERTSAAALYSDDPILEILRGIRGTEDAECAAQEEQKEVVSTVGKSIHEKSQFDGPGFEPTWHQRYADADAARRLSSKPGAFKYADGRRQC